MKPGELRMWTMNTDLHSDVPFLVVSVSEDGKWATILDDGDTYTLGPWDVEGISTPLEDSNEPS
jgi:hypothetical protein